MDEDRLARVQALLGGASLEDTWAAPSTSEQEEIPTLETPDSEEGEFISPKTRFTINQSGSVKKSESSALSQRDLATDERSTENHIKAEEPGWEEYQLSLGQFPAEDESFCPWKTVKRYPYCYIGNTNRPKVDKKFFADGRLAKRTWDFFYLHHKEGSNPILLVPTKQFQHFLTVINKKLNISLTIPHLGLDGGFEFTFPNDGTPRPRYLGRSTSSKMVEDYTKGVPPPAYVPQGEDVPKEAPSDRSLEAFRAKIDLMTQAQKGKKLANKAKAKADRIAQQKSWSHAIKRVQRYLGLRDIHHDYSERVARIREKHEAQGLEWLELAAAVEKEAANIPSSVKFDPDQPSIFPQEDSVIFVCVDVEAWERNKNVITEIGISTLDTKDLENVAPGNGGENWMKAIRARHFRIIENKYYENKDFVRGCADKFEFGESEFIKLKDAPAAVGACFKFPFSDPDACQSQADTERNIILVGHDVKADIAFLKSIGYNVLNLRNLKESQDTAALYRYLRHEPHPRNLGHILADLGLVGWNLHNAGNDAVYTLQALIGISVSHIAEKQKNKQRHEQDFHNRTQEATDEAKERTLEQNEGWSSADEVGGEEEHVFYTTLPIHNKISIQSPQRNQSPASRNRYSDNKAFGFSVSEVRDSPTLEGSPIKKVKSISIEEEMSALW